MNDIKRQSSLNTQFESKSTKVEKKSYQSDTFREANAAKVETLNIVNKISSIGVGSKDPFVSYLSTPITSSKIVEAYLNLLPTYRANLSPLLKGISMGFAHGYFLVGPFAKLGPLRDTLAANFIGFLSAISLIIILTTGLTIYGSTTYSLQMQNSDYSLQSSANNDSKVNFFNLFGWRQLSSGFILGGFCGSGVAYMALTLLN